VLDGVKGGATASGTRSDARSVTEAFVWHVKLTASQYAACALCWYEGGVDTSQANGVMCELIGSQHGSAGIGSLLAAAG